jgi:hypothetical protein
MGFKLSVLVVVGSILFLCAALYVLDAMAAGI